jgi:tetratricopeptide (TPR) repeat protein
VMNATFCRSAILTLLVLTPLTANAQAARTHTVSRILLDGKQVSSAAGVTVTPRSGPAGKSLRLQERIADGTRVDVPAHVVVVIVSTGALSTARLEPGASVTFVSTGKGEQVRTNAGQVFFDVVHDALDFFRVQYGNQIVAGVDGTAFSVIAGSKAVTFACRRDAISITKTGFLVIAAQRKKVSLVDTLSAKQPPLTYAPAPNWVLGTFANYAAAEASFQRQLTVAKNAHDRYAQANALNNIGIAQWYQGQAAAALQSHQQALAFFRALGQRDGQARALDNIGIVQTAQGRYADAQQSYEAALALYRAEGDQDGEANALMNAGIAQRFLEQNAASLDSQQQALKLFRSLNDRDGEANALGNIGIVQGILGQDAVSLQSFQQVLALHRELGDRDGEARDLNNVGIAQQSLRQYPAALQTALQALALHQQLGDRDGEARAKLNIGVLQDLQRQYAAARASAQQALALFQAVADLDGEARANQNIGATQEEQGDFDGALVSYQKALAIFQQITLRGSDVTSMETSIARVKAHLAAPK